jgi:hypothetical protein
MPYGTLGAATTLRSQPPQHSAAGAPLPAAGREATKGAVTPAPEVAPFPAQIFTHFKTLAMACVNFTITMPIGLTGAFRPVLGQKTNSPPNLFRFGGFSHTCHCHSYAYGGFFTLSSGATTRRSQNRFPTRRGGFYTPGTGGAITGATDAVPVLSTGTARGWTSDLFSSQPRPELGGSPVDTCLHPWQRSDQLGVLQ